MEVTMENRVTFYVNYMSFFKHSKASTRLECTINLKTFKGIFNCYFLALFITKKLSSVEKTYFVKRTAFRYSRK